MQSITVFLLELRFEEKVSIERFTIISTQLSRIQGNAWCRYLESLEGRAAVLGIEQSQQFLEPLNEDARW